MAESIDDVAHSRYNREKAKGRQYMKKTISMSIRVSEEDLEKLKLAAELLSYSSYSEFVRRTALIEATRVIKESESVHRNGGDK